ncbi:MAG TPA: glycosyltransferase [Verrucomicrobiae bacterium]|nr:glycosyltransferase [Verrucomicrobiae bacterium]
MAAREHLLLYEPRTEGHHLGWLRFLTEDLLSANWQLSLAVDLRPKAHPQVEDHLSGLLGQAQLLSAGNLAGAKRAGSTTASIIQCLHESGAGRVFLPAFDEVASGWWRRAALGFYPPAQLRGQIGGIYHRPRFMIAPRWSPNRWLKWTGFSRMLRQGWIRQLLFVDEFLAADLQKRFPGAPLFFLPDPCPEGYEGNTAEARRQLGLPAEKWIFLFFGLGHRRKGLHLAVEAMLQLDSNSPAFLLCAGQLNPQGTTAEGLQQLAQKGRARLINRYVSAAEEKLCFAACDSVLLPYINHFGTSGVLSRAMAAGKMVVVSDEQLLGRLTRERGLGLVFPSGEVQRLRLKLEQAMEANAAQAAAWRAAAQQYARHYSRQAYRAALLQCIGLPSPFFPNA